MTLEIGIVLGILAAAVALFVSERIRVDLVAMLVMVSLALTGLLSGSDAIKGFGNPAVITVASVLVLSGGLIRTGVGNLVGQRLLGRAATSEWKLTAMVVLVAGLFSSVMNNIAVAALFIPVVLDIARRSGHAPSRLLIPMAYGVHLGGLITLIGTAPNILVSGALEDAGQKPFHMFDFTPFGVIALAVGGALLVFPGRTLLPRREHGAGQERPDLKGLYQLGNVLFRIRISEDSPLAGRSLGWSRLGRVLGLLVLGVSRRGQMIHAPDPSFLLRPGDLLLATGRLDRFRALRDWKYLLLRPGADLGDLLSESVRFAEIKLSEGSAVTGRNVREAEFRKRFGVQVLSLSDRGVVRRSGLRARAIRPGTTLVVSGRPEAVERLRQEPEIARVRFLETARLLDTYRSERWLRFMEVLGGEFTEGKTLAESRLGAGLGLNVLAIVRDQETIPLPGPDAVIQNGDLLLVEARKEEIERLQALQDLNVRESPGDLSSLETDTVGIVEASLSPRTSLHEKPIRELGFRRRYGLSILGVWRGGKPWDPGFGDLPLRHGDAFLVYGPRNKLRLLAEDPDFYVLNGRPADVRRPEKAPISIGIMALVVLTAVFGWFPIHVAAPAGAALMVLTGCLRMEEAYGFLEPRALVLIAGMLGLGLAMQQTGAAAWMASSILGRAAALGPVFVVGTLFLLTSLTAQFIPTTVAAVLLAPIALGTGVHLGLSPRALLMTVALGASTPFLSPIGHPVNLLVMGFGGYRFTDYTRVGVPLVLLQLTITMLMVPLLFPLQ